MFDWSGKLVGGGQDPPQNNLDQTRTRVPEKLCVLGSITKLGLKINWLGRRLRKMVGIKAISVSGL